MPFLPSLSTRVSSQRSVVVIARHKGPRNHPKDNGSSLGPRPLYSLALFLIQNAGPRRHLQTPPVNFFDVEAPIAADPERRDLVAVNQSVYRATV